MTDLEIVQHIKDRDIKGWEYAFDKYSPPVYGFLLKKMDNIEVAESILQDVFVYLWREISTFDQKTKLLTFILKVTWQYIKEYQENGEKEYSGYRIQGFDFSPLSEHNDNKELIYQTKKALKRHNIYNEIKHKISRILGLEGGQQPTSE